MIEVLRSRESEMDRGQVHANDGGGIVCTGVSVVRQTHTWPIELVQEILGQ